MPKPTFPLALSLLLAPAASLPLSAWGALGHQMVATAALKDLPPGLAPWFTGQEATVRKHATDPDHWKEHDPLEGPKHYLDCEPYGGAAEVPVNEDSARARLGPELFQKNGQVPWTILARVQSLTQAFTKGDADQVAFEASILCHYTGDISVPLHTSSNHDGQDTGQQGVHRRWETELLERIVKQEDWVPDIRQAESGPDPQVAPWAWLVDSYSLVPGLLKDDRHAEAGSGDGRHAEAWSGDGRRTEPWAGEALSRAYWRRFLKRQGPHIKEQLTLAAQRTAQMILFAWDQAGRPAAPGNERSR